MAKKIYFVGENIYFVDGVQVVARTLDEIVKGSHSAHKARHQNGGADKVNIAGLSGEPADTVNKTGVQTIAGVKTFTSSPIVPTPTTDMQASTKKYIDDSLDTIESEKVEIEEIGTATYDDLQDWINNTQSAGYIVGGVITATDPADGTIAISAVKGFLKITDSEIGVTKSFDLAGTTAFALTDKQTNYIFVNFVGGPKFDVTTTRADIELNRQFTLGRVYRDGNDTHIIQSGVQLPNFLRESHERLLAVRGFEQASGGAISESGNRYLVSTGGIFYLGNNKTTTTGKNTNNGDTFTRHYHTGGVWASDVKSQIAEGGAGFYKYDDGTDLQNLSNNKYGVFWVFIHFDGDLHVVVGRGDYTLTEAQAATVPTTPNSVTDFATLAAKIILLEDATNFLAVQGAYEIFFPLDGGFDHNDLGNIQGGAADDYYHLTAAQLTEALLFAQSGWIASGETWTYASASTFTISGDKTGKYQIGDKIKLTQTTVKYFNVIGVAYADTTTTITITGGTDYSLADAAITLPYYSKIENPQGFPGWFNWTPTYACTGDMTYTSVTTLVAKYAVIDKMCFFQLSCSGTTGGVANIAIDFTLSVNSAESVSGYFGGGCYIFDATHQAGNWYNIGANQIRVNKQEGADWGLGSGRLIRIQGFYRIA